MKVPSVRTGHTHSPRQIQLEECLFANMQQLPYNIVSISDLCRQVGISRRAFYLYFKDKDDCLFSLIQRKFQNLLLATATSVPEDADDLETCCTFLAIFKKHHHFFDVMLRNQQMANIVFQVVHYATHGGDCFLPTKEVSVSQIDTDLLTCLVTSQVALMLRWQNKSYEAPVEEMAVKLLKLTTIVLP